MRQIVYRNVSDTPPSSVSLDWLFDDGNTASAQGAGGPLTAAASMTVSIIASNDDPAINSSATHNVAENQTAALTVVSSDVDGGAPTYSINSGTDAALFSIDPNSGELTFNVAPDFESPGDTDGDNVFEVVVEVADGFGGTDTQAIALTVINVNEAPIITSDATGSATENQTSVLSVTSTDVDGGAPEYSIISGSDAALFTIDPNSGELTFNAAPDFENPDDADGNNVYELVVEVADGFGGTDCLLYTSPSPRDGLLSRMPSSA